MLSSKENEKISMSIIANSGDAKSYAFAALDKAKCAQFDECDQLIEKSENCLIKAHQAHTQVLSDAINQDFTMDLLFVHAQDQLMMSMTSIDLIKEMINLYKEIKK